MARSTEQVFQDHMGALARGDSYALKADYDDDSVLMTMDAIFSGREAILGFFTTVYTAMPNARLESVGMQVQGELVLFAWKATFDGGTIPHGVDTFVIRDDRIRVQTVWFTVGPT
jgi:predicted SnoaL-like aldol condensation-catalyzing enzyme